MIGQKVFLDYKAILVGVFVTIVVLLSSQLAYVLIASYVGDAANQISWINHYKDTFWFVLSALAFAISFFIGGIVVSLASKNNHAKPVILNALIVALIVNMLSVFTAADASLLNSKAVILTVLNILSAGYGAYWSVRES